MPTEPSPHVNTRRPDAAKPAPPWHASHRAPLYFLVLSILCQVIGIGILSLVQDALMHPLVLLGLHSLIAFFLARWLQLSLPWQLFNLLLAPGVILYSYLELPSGVALIALVLALLMYAPTFWTRVPYFPTHPKMYDRILQLIPGDKPIQVIDLGCGTGGLLLFLAAHRPLASFVGVEISPLAFIVAKLRALVAGHRNISIELKNFWNLSLGEFDVVYAFLAPGPMPGLWSKVQDEMKGGSIFITNTFAVDSDPHHTERIQVDGSHQDALYVHHR